MNRLNYLDFRSPNLFHYLLLLSFPFSFLAHHNAARYAKIIAPPRKEGGGHRCSILLRSRVQILTSINATRRRGRRYERGTWNGMILLSLEGLVAGLVIIYVWTAHKSALRKWTRTQSIFKHNIRQAYYQNFEV